MWAGQGEGRGSGGMSTYFNDQGKRGEHAELKEELASTDKNKKRDAVKKVIRDMTLGKDVSGLFSAVVNNMMTPNLEVRKLVYLYLINYAKTQPELAIMAVNGFVKDARWASARRPAPARHLVCALLRPCASRTRLESCPAACVPLSVCLRRVTLFGCSDPNPLIRALAVRTMGCIRVESISEYLCESLR